MRTLAQISDLHFGRVDERLLHPLRDALARAHPDLLVVSGDLTQRARHSQFAQARAFLDSLPFPRIVIPGNHDIPLYDVVERMSKPLRRYARWFGSEKVPFHVDDAFAVVGFNTTWRWSVQDGRLRESQFHKARTLFSGIPEGVLKVVVTHHPLTEGREGADGKGLLRADRALRAFAALGVDLFLSGHRHLAGLFDSTHVVQVPGYNALLVEAGTATSDRVRGEENAFNVMTYQPPVLRVVHWRWHPAEERFLPAEREEYLHGVQGWTRGQRTAP